MTNSFRGVLPALITPLTPAGAPDPGTLEKLLERLYGAGSHGMYVCGQTGEGLLLPVDARKTVAEIVTRSSPPDKQIIVHVGAARTEDAVRLASHARQCGAHAIASLPPSGAYTFPEIKAYYERLASVGLPLFVYYFPEVAPNVSADQVFELAVIPNVAGVKFTDFDLYRLARLRSAGLIVFNGRDEVFAAGLLMGASGGIGSFYNIAPELFVEAYDHAERGDWEAARRTQQRINELISLVLRYPLLPVLKRILGWSGLDCGPCVEPRRALTSSEEDRLAGDLAQSQFAHLLGAAAEPPRV
jgi:N-acetylneuraminate lyase